MTPDEQIDIDLQIERDLRAARTKRAAEAETRATADRSAALGGEFPSAGEVVLAEQADLDVPLPGVAAAVGATALAFGWYTARRTLMASRPNLTRKWFGVFGPVMWKCGRCSTNVALGADRCGVCGQYQTWPKWTLANQ